MGFERLTTSCVRENHVKVANTIYETMKASRDGYTPISNFIQTYLDNYLRASNNRALACMGRCPIALIKDFIESYYTYYKIQTANGRVQLNSLEWKIIALVYVIFTDFARILQPDGVVTSVWMVRIAEALEHSIYVSFSESSQRFIPKFYEINSAMRMHVTELVETYKSARLEVVSISRRLGLDRFEMAHVKFTDHRVNLWHHIYMIMSQLVLLNTVMLDDQGTPTQINEAIVKTNEMFAQRGFRVGRAITPAYQSNADLYQSIELTNQYNPLYLTDFVTYNDLPDIKPHADMVMHDRETLDSIHVIGQLLEANQSIDSLMSNANLSGKTTIEKISRISR